MIKINFKNKKYIIFIIFQKQKKPPNHPLNCRRRRKNESKLNGLGTLGRRVQ
jgi:hypothetical protein